jgi:hypothetical protein
MIAMPHTHPVQELIDRLRGSGMLLDEIRPHLHHGAALVRSHAIEAMAGKLQANPEVLPELLEAVVDPANSIRLMGTISVAHVGVASLLRASCDEARQGVKRLLATWPQPDRDDLLWYLESEGLSVD